MVTFRESSAPLLEVGWVDRDLHERCLDLQLERPRGISLADAVSFACIPGARVNECSLSTSTSFRKGLPE